MAVKNLHTLYPLPFSGYRFADYQEGCQIMATAVALLMCSNIFIQVIPIVEGITHWVVTEDGRIQAQVGTASLLRVLML